VKTFIKSLIYLLPIFLIGILVGRSWIIANSYEINHSLGQCSAESNSTREQFIQMKDDMISEMINNEEYKCCLEKPCTYCIEKSPGHGEGATCSCLEDVVNGVHPCGECIGEILEGHGNRFVAKYFATSIAEEVGTEHTDSIKQIIEEKYGVPASEQI
jgi:hypothetical protein